MRSYSEIHHKKFRGYSLIELMFYIATFVGISVLAINALFFLIRSWGQVRAYKSLSRAGTNSMERMLREVRFAKAIRAGESTLRVSPSVLSLDTFTDPSSEDPAVTKFYLDDGVLMVEENGLAGALTPSNVTVNEFIVWDVVNANLDPIVKMEINLTSSPGTNFAHTATFTTTAILRGSY